MISMISAFVDDHQASQSPFRKVAFAHAVEELTAWAC